MCVIVVSYFVWSHFGFWNYYHDIFIGTSHCFKLGMSVFYVVSRKFFVWVFKHLFIASTYIVVSAVDVTAPVMSLRTWFCITSNLLKVAGVVIFFASLPYCRVGCIYRLCVALSIQGCPICFLQNFSAHQFILILSLIEDPCLSVGSHSAAAFTVVFDHTSYFTEERTWIFVPTFQI
jgi:hypothetical protein